VQRIVRAEFFLQPAAGQLTYGWPKLSALSTSAPTPGIRAINPNAHVDERVARLQCPAGSFSRPVANLGIGGLERTVTDSTTYGFTFRDDWALPFDGFFAMNAQNYAPTQPPSLMGFGMGESHTNEGGRAKINGEES
jgi:hypothetical protein